MYIVFSDNKLLCFNFYEIYAKMTVIRSLKTSEADFEHFAKNSSRYLFHKEQKLTYSLKSFFVVETKNIFQLPVYKLLKWKLQIHPS